MQYDEAAAYATAAGREMPRGSFTLREARSWRPEASESSEASEAEEAPEASEAAGVGGAAEAEEAEEAAKAAGAAEAEEGAAATWMDGTEAVEDGWEVQDATDGKFVELWVHPASGGGRLWFSFAVGRPKSPNAAAARGPLLEVRQIRRLPDAAMGAVGSDEVTGGAAAEREATGGAAEAVAGSAIDGRWEADASARAQRTFSPAVAAHRWAEAQGTPCTNARLFPTSHFVMAEAERARVISDIRRELGGRLEALRTSGRFLEAERLEARVTADLEEIVARGYCKGLENYSRHLTGRCVTGT